MDAKIAYFRSLTFALSTQKSYSSYYKSYVKFCTKLGYPLAPISTPRLCRYIAELSARLSPNSIPKYLTIVRLIHLEMGLPNPLDTNWQVQSLIRGIKREKGSFVTKKLPITPDILYQISLRLNFQLQLHTVFWAVCLTLFFSFMRKGNVLVPASNFNPDVHLRRCDFTMSTTGISILVRHSKTIQFRERILLIPLSPIPKHPLCPISALLKSFLATPGADPSGPPFVLGAQGKYIPLSPQRFQLILREHLDALGYDPQNFSGHSFRRGAASWALQVGIPSEVIQILGDWRSDAYKEYIDISQSSKLRYISIFSNSIGNK